jgi:hypothetical protein
MRRLIGNELNPECPSLAIDPFMKAAAHPTATVVKHFNSFDFFW